MATAVTSEYVMGFDLGGGSIRCLLLELATRAVTCAHHPYASDPAAGTAGLGYDLDLAAISAGLGAACQKVLARAGASAAEISGIAATSMRLGMVVLDGAGAPLLAVPNRDARAVSQGLTLAAQHPCHDRRRRDAHE